ncbi:flagellin [Lutibaculum baratangense]|uniref:Flagellin N-terminal domain-containing protein n=1 Tax=Lutibaculum baratangense AMV1 TaxID=631454 RepID=V4TLU6_9HYPH|nr:flagellin [Lutibaculum baratangense]ESR26763.1 hypothetical protein N177_0547 [Lutibaculum baratangense AMV1]
MAIAPLSHSAGWLRGISEARNQMFDLQRQLTTGKKADLYSGLGGGGAIDTAVRMRARVDTLGAYQSSVKLVASRMDTMETVLGRYDALTRETRTAVANTMPLADLPNPLTLKQQARYSLDEAVTLLNSELGGRQLFSGRALETEPVISASKIIDGDPPLAGFDIVAADRLKADLGDDGLGRLDLGVTDSTVTLSEDAAGSVFGFKISGVTSTLGGDTTVTAPAGDPAVTEVTFGATLPEKGQSISFKLDMPDGTSTTIKLTAVATPSEEKNTFVIGEDADETAANMKAALQEAVGFAAKTELSAASSFAAANDFFDNDPPLRVDTSSLALGEATGLRSGADDTVRWYKGANSSDPRSSSVASVSDELDVKYGAQANEKELRATLKNLAVMSVADYELPGKEGEGLYTAKSQRLITNLYGAAKGINEVRADVAMQRVTVEKADERNKLQKTTAEDLLGSVEDADINEVAVMLLQLQTQLQGSYQVTAMLSQLSLVKLL